jgi:hypothetical protein
MIEPISLSRYRSSKARPRIVVDQSELIDVQKFLNKKEQSIPSEDEQKILFLLSTYWAQGFAPIAGNRYVPTGRFYKLFYEPLQSYSLGEAFNICMGNSSFENLSLSANSGIYRHLITVEFVANIIEHRYGGKIIYKDIQWRYLKKNKHQFMSTNEALSIVPLNPLS